MMQRRVSAPTMTMKLKTHSCEDLCNCNQRIPPPQNRQALVRGNCIKVVNSTKSVVSSFTDSAKLISHFLIVFGFMQALNGHQSAIDDQLSATNNAASPPSDLPTFNSNLRIQSPLRYSSYLTTRRVFGLEARKSNVLYCNSWCKQKIIKGQKSCTTFTIPIFSERHF